jgi:hypothetical protein
MNAGVARTRLTPFWGVELSGWGYYLGRTWRRVRDHLAATALVAEDGGRSAAVIAVDLMYADRGFCDAVRGEVAHHTGIPPEAVCVAASHSHNTPTAGLIRGAGEMHTEYLAWAARQAATAAILAHRQMRPARLSIASTNLTKWTVNRSRDGGPVDTRLTLWRIDDDTRRPLAAVVNFAGHPTVQMCLGPADVSRDYPGQVTDLLERELPGVTALFLQGACGEVNVRPDRHVPDLCHTPGVAIAQVALQCWREARPPEQGGVTHAEHTATIPTRRWEESEILPILRECEYRLATGETEGWLDGFARVVVCEPARLPTRYGGSVEAAVRAVARFGKEWADEALRSTQGEGLPMRFQALKVGGAFLAAVGAEFFSSTALGLRRSWGDGLVVAAYANESVGYLPDADDVARRTYAAYQSPKFKGLLPFTGASADAAAAAMLGALAEVRDA